MVHDSMRNLEFDKRLARRRGWVEPERLRQALEDLSDATDKIRPEEQAETPAPPAGSGAPTT